MSLALSICDYSGNALNPWAKAGYECWAIDIDHEGDETIDGIRYLKADVRWFRPPCQRDIAICMAWPPCTHLAVSGARWFAGKGLACLRDAIDLVAHCEQICLATGAPWFIENPVSTLSTYWRKPDHIFDPCDYGDDYTKRTCLWTGGGFLMPEKNRVEATAGSKMHLLPPSDNRARLRSETPMGFANAVFAANHRSNQ